VADRTGMAAEGTDRSPTARVRRALVTALGVTAFFAVWLGLNVGGDEVVLRVDDVGTFVAALVASVLCVAAARRGGGLSRLWWLFGAACAAWALGEFLWGLYELVLLKDVPTPSWADAAYLAAIPLAVAGLLSHPAMRNGATRRLRAALDGLVVATALLSLSWTLVLGPMAHSSDLSAFGGVVNLAYPFGDVVLVFFVVLIVRRIERRDALVVWCLLGGLLAMALTDTVYAYVSQVKGFETGSLMDTGWIAAYVAIAVGAYCSRGTSVASRRAESSLPTPASFLAPFPPVLGALGVAAFQMGQGQRLDHVAWGVSLALVLLVLARQALLLKELIWPRHGDEVELSSRLISALTDAP
jgi:hypothetical protein